MFSHLLKLQFLSTYNGVDHLRVADQVEQYEASGGTEANTLMDTGIPIIVVTMVGHKTGHIRKIALMRVEHEGEYALVASKGGAPEHPGWYHNLKADPRATVQHRGGVEERVAREALGAERDELFRRAAATFSNFEAYQRRADTRTIPVMVLSLPGEAL